MKTKNFKNFQKLKNSGHPECVLIVACNQLPLYCQININSYTTSLHKYIQNMSNSKITDYINTDCQRPC